MAGKTSRRILKDILENLSKENFDKFRSELLDRRDGVKTSQVEGKNYLGVTDVMISTYTERRALSVAEEILRGIRCVQDADKLVEQAKKAGLQAAAGGSSDVEQAKKAGLQAAAGGSSDEEHFVDKHRKELIQKANCISPILDELLKVKVIQDEEYDKILATATSQDKMRQLFTGPLRASTAAKDVFFKILKEQQPYLVQDLMTK